MVNLAMTVQDVDLASVGLDDEGIVYHNFPAPVLVEHAIRQGEGELGEAGTFVTQTGKHTGRSPRDKFLVEQDSSKEEIWWGQVNQPLSEAHFESLYRRMQDYYRGRDAYVLDAAAAADPQHRMRIRVVTDHAWYSLFSGHIFIKATSQELEAPSPEFTILHAADLHAVPEEDGTNSEAFIVLNLERRLALIGGTRYAGEIKKTIFTVLNYVLPTKGVMSMHCSANVGSAQDVALFFGLSGTGKTTLSSDTDRGLIGDDEHGWGDHGVFNIEGGCYAKMIRLREEQEPVIWHAVHQFGAVLENVILDPETRTPRFDDDRLTENTRGAYPITNVANHVPGGRAGHPKNIFFLAADAFGSLPPISKLTPDQAMYYFLSGYTSKLAGTEKGVGSEPQATFSTCFAAPFLPLHPSVYAKLLREKIAAHGTHVWLLNTGWTGGGYGVGHRIELKHTRAMVHAALDGELDQANWRTDPIFGLSVPVSCPNVPEEVLNPRRNWADASAYDEQAKALARRFRENFEMYRSDVPDSVYRAGPKA